MVMSQDDVMSSIDNKIASLEKNLKSLESELDAVATNLAVYKRELYGKFGTDNINLED
jgi:archaellum component FlaC